MSQTSKKSPPSSNTPKTSSAIKEAKALAAAVAELGGLVRAWKVAEQDFKNTQEAAKVLLAPKRWDDIPGAAAVASIERVRDLQRQALQEFTSAVTSRVQGTPQRARRTHDPKVLRDIARQVCIKGDTPNANRKRVAEAYKLHTGLTIHPTDQKLREIVGSWHRKFGSH